MHMRYSDRLDVGRGLASGSRNRRREAGSVMMLFTLMLPFLLVPLVGLAIDSTLMYSVKAKLQSAVDGGAIAAAQSLNSGLTFVSQKAAAEKAAGQFIKANFIVKGDIAGYNGYWGAYNLNDTTCDASGQPVAGGTSSCIVALEDNTNKRRTVSVSASVQVPLLFMRILGFSTGTVTAKGTAARRDVVLVLVLDRSSSMDNVIGGVNVIDALKGAAAYFVSQFQSGRDRLGLVVFGGSAIVAYPVADWNPAGAPVGPDTQFQDPANTPNMLTSISNVAIGSNTGTAEALTLAYRELVAANQPGALNVIVLFTDGLPNGITANFNNATTGVINNTNPKSPCTHKTDGVGTVYNSKTATSMIGWMAQVNGYKSGTSTATDGRGIFSLAQTTTTQNSVTNWLKNGNEPVLPDSGAGSPSHGCAYVGDPSLITPTGSPAGSTNPGDLTGIPSMDFYGNSTTGVNSGSYHTTDYQLSEIWGNAGECNNGHRAAGQDLTKEGDACQVGLASWNATDMAGKKIREDATLTPVIYTMGFTGNGGIDSVLMQRLSNIKGASAVYDAAKPGGLFLPISVPGDIAPAFQTLLSEILRLTF